MAQGLKDVSSAHKSQASPGNIRGLFGWLRAEAREMSPVFVFFLSGFLLVLLIVKLALAEYSITVNALSRALLGAVLAAKVVLLLEQTPLARPFRQLPRIVPIAFKSLVYGMGVIVLGYLERLVDSIRHSRAILIGIQTADASLNLNRLLSVALGVTAVFGIYFTFVELSEFIGGDALRGFLLTSRTHSPKSSGG
jgi:hypothetical protein